MTQGLHGLEIRTLTLLELGPECRGTPGLVSTAPASTLLGSTC